MSDLRGRARAWLAEDPDPATRAELEDLLSRDDDAAVADLADRFAGTLEFGTAGLRGAIGAGPHRMNRVVVTRAAAGLAAYLREQGAGPGDTVVIGYDARHRSEDFARDTAEVVAGAGLGALLLPRALPTPVLAFAVRHLGAVAGVMVTASHNPSADNGYKVYLGDGCQIVPPADTDIAAHIDAVGALAEVPRSSAWDRLDDTVLEAYTDGVAALARPGPRELRWVYTPMHGVGGAVAAEVAARAGFPAAHVVAEQAEPDPDFPTVAFPNPEEPGALDLALGLAARVHADLVVANDPDADRCAVAVPAPDAVSGSGDTGAGAGWRVLRGDELGALLGDLLLREGVEGVYARSIVSSSLLGAMAAAHARPAAETLTGFKWIARVEGLAFGYEEALGYAVAPGLVRDKDGLSALVRVLELAAALAAHGRTLQDRLDDLAREHGVHATDQLSVRVTDLSVIAEAMRRLRSAPPAGLGGLAVERAEDLADGVDGLPPTDGLRYRLERGARVVVRPSGTEPKLKCYLEVVVPVGAHDDLEPARRRAAALLADIKTDLARAAGV